MWWAFHHLKYEMNKLTNGFLFDRWQEYSLHLFDVEDIETFLSAAFFKLCYVVIWSHYKTLSIIVQHCDCSKP